MLLLLALFLAPCGPDSVACTCIQRPEPRTIEDVREALSSADALFAGYVLHTRYRRDSTWVRTTKGDSTWFRSTTLVATVTLEQSWKGQLRDTLQVETAAQTTACGASLRTGEHYLIDAGRLSDSVFATSKCGWTRPLSEAVKLQALLQQAAAKWR
jgi:hypothetical protein